ncbi:unnamed protein product, partial [Brassica oleracea]
CREVITISNQHINSKNSNLHGRIWRRRATMTRKKEKERERERQDQYKKDTYGVLSGSKTFSHCFFFGFFFITFYEALP